MGRAETVKSLFGRNKEPDIEHPFRIFHRQYARNQYEPGLQNKEPTPQDASRGCRVRHTFATGPTNSRLNSY